MQLSSWPSRTTQPQTKWEVKPAALEEIEDFIAAEVGRLQTKPPDSRAKLQLYREALEGSRETLGATHPNTLASMNNLGALLEDRGNLDEAEPLYRDALEGKRETLGATHPSTLASINNLGALLKAKGDLDGAEPLLREALQGRRETLSDRHAAR